MDGNLNWKTEITHVANTEGSKSIGIIRKSIFYLSTKSLRTLYFSLVYRYFFLLQFCLDLYLQNSQLFVLTLFRLGFFGQSVSLKPITLGS